MSRRSASDVYAEVEAAEHAEVRADLDAFKAKIEQDRADRKARWTAFKYEATRRGKPTETIAPVEAVALPGDDPSSPSKRRGRCDKDGACNGGNGGEPDWAPFLERAGPGGRR